MHFLPSGDIASAVEAPATLCPCPKDGTVELWNWFLVQKFHLAGTRGLLQFPSPPFPLPAAAGSTKPEVRASPGFFQHSRGDFIPPGAAAGPR